MFTNTRRARRFSIQTTTYLSNTQPLPKVMPSPTSNPTRTPTKFPTIRSPPVNMTTALSSGRRNGLGEDLIWFPPTEGLSRASVELAGDGIEIALRVAGEIRPLREVLPE